MKILLTGATGFIGRVTLNRLLADGQAIRAAVRKLPPDADPRVEWRVIGDLTGDVDWPVLLAGVDAVVHLAALAHQVGRQGQGRRDEFMRANAEMTGEIARAARAAQVRRFVLLGSVAATGGRGEQAIDETAEPRPEGDYGASKLAAEFELERALEGSNVSWVVLRAPLVFGPGNRGNMGRLLQLLQRGWPLPFGGLTNSRSFIYVDNLVDAIATCLAPGCPAQGIYFVDDGTRLSTPSLCAALAQAGSLDLRLFYCPRFVLQVLGWIGDLGAAILRRDLPISSYSIDRLGGSLVVDGRKFAAATDWKPPVATLEAIRRTVT